MDGRVSGEDAARRSSIFTGGGEAGALMRTLDWSATPLGPMSTWPASLKTIVGTMLHSRHPMFLWWGPELIQFYNDAYVPSFGARQAPGRDGTARRGLLAGDLADHLAADRRRDEPRQAELERGSPRADLSQRPHRGGLLDLRLLAGASTTRAAIGGTLVVCTETTSASSRSDACDTLHALAEATALADTWASVMRSCRRGPGGLARRSLCVASISREGAEHRLVRSVGLTREAAAAIDTWARPQLAALARAGVPAPMAASLHVPVPRGSDVVSDGVRAHGRHRGQRSRAIVLFGLSPRLPFDATYREYLRQLAEQSGHAEARLEALRIRLAVESERNHLLEQAPVATALLMGPGHVFELANPLYQRDRRPR